MSAEVITTRGLTKRFGTRVAVDDVDLAIPAGVISGFIGPNGAGKTTTMRMLLGLIRPTAGDGRVLCQPLSHPEAFLDRVGAMIEGPAFYPTLSGRANLAALARLEDIPATRIANALERVGMADRASDPFRSYSHGMKQRLGIAAALLPQPELLVLDEPTNGLDPAGIAEMRRLMRSLADDGITVFVSSHLLAEVQQICEHLVMIRSGRLVFQGTVDELTAAQHSQLLARTEKPEDIQRLLELVTAAGRSAHVEGDLLCVTDGQGWAGELNRLAMGAGMTIVDLSERRATLEEAFFKLTGGTGDVGPPTSETPGHTEQLP